MSLYTDKQQREIFHLLFLERLLRTSTPSFYILKGGVNLRFFFESPRYSEDMDIDVVGGSVATLKKNGYKILQDAAFQRTLQTYGIDALKVADPSTAKHTETVQRFKVRLVNSIGQELPTKVEFSRRKVPKNDEAPNEVISSSIVRPYKRLAFACFHYAHDSAVTQKIKALAGRSEVQARDVFDLYTLNLGGHLNKELVSKRSTKAERKKAQEALSLLDYHAYRGQVLEYLESSHFELYSTKAKWNEMSDMVMEILSD